MRRVGAVAVALALLVTAAPASSQGATDDPGLEALADIVGTYAGIWDVSGYSDTVLENEVTIAVEGFADLVRAPLIATYNLTVSGSGTLIGVPPDGFGCAEFEFGFGPLEARGNLELDPSPDRTLFDFEFSGSADLTVAIKLDCDSRGAIARFADSVGLDLVVTLQRDSGLPPTVVGNLGGISVEDVEIDASTFFADFETPTVLAVLEAAPLEDDSDSTDEPAAEACEDVPESELESCLLGDALDGFLDAAGTSPDQVAGLCPNEQRFGNEPIETLYCWEGGDFDRWRTTIPSGTPGSIGMGISAAGFLRRYASFDDVAALGRDNSRDVPLFPATTAALPVLRKLAQRALAGDTSAGVALDRFAQMVYLQDLDAILADQRARAAARAAAEAANA